MMRELDMVVLTTELPELEPKPGDVGTVVLEHAAGAGYEVEFVTLDGDTVAVTTLRRDQIRPTGGREILHARALAA